jgi:hypothetical protein
MSELKYSNYFGCRYPGEPWIVYLKDESPQILRDLVYKIHMSLFFDSWNNNWIDEVIHNAFETYEMEEDRAAWEDLSFQIEADCMYSDLYNWFGHSFADEFCNEYGREYPDLKLTVYDMIAGGQWLAKQRIYQAVYEFLISNPMETKDES